MSSSKNSRGESGSTRQIAFVVTVLTGITGLITIWDRCSSIIHKPAADSVTQVIDSPARPANALHRPEFSVLPHKHHPKTDMKPVSAERPEDNPGGESGQGVAAAPVLKPTPRLPLQLAYAEDIEFTLLSAEGSKQAQTIKITLVLTNRAANRFIWSAVESISDPDGNEYLIKSFTNGASAYDIHIPLDTDVPRKCTYTFGGILPAVKTIKLFKFRYRHKSLDDPNSVEFRDIPVDWK